jgi:hypothetical protein
LEPRLNLLSLQRVGSLVVNRSHHLLVWVEVELDSLELSQLSKQLAADYLAWVQVLLKRLLNLPVASQA